MSFLEKLCLKLFSLLTGIITILILLIMVGILEINDITKYTGILTENMLNIRITIITCFVLLLLSIKCLLFSSRKDDTGKDGIILENGSGKLVISKESLENMISSVAKEIQGTESITSRTVLDRERNLKVFVTIVVSRDIMLKDISKELQNRIKDAMKRTADLEVKEVNVRVKNITSKRVKGVTTNETTAIQNETKSEIQVVETTNEEKKVESEIGEE